MHVQQVSVFLDNRPGSLSEVMNHLDKRQIKIFALSIADAGEYGLVRMVTDDPEKATKILEDADFNLAKSKKNIEVVAVLITEKATMSNITQILSKSGLNIEYAYSSAVHTDGKFALILRVNDLNKAEQILKENNIATLTLQEMKQHFQ
ncbi:MAG: acetolactate synthase [Candidatus Bathyarchaeota archaeon]|nr:acetolactate synthase [Candidatus Bathyarchaeota archaeon]